MTKMTLLICIEARIYCEGLKKVLSEHPEIRRARICNIDQLSSIPKGDRDVVLVDIRLQDDAMGSVRAAFDASCGRPIVALGLDVNDDAMLEAFEAGAAACITSDQSIDELIAFLRAVSEGELVCPPKIGRMMQERLISLSADKLEIERLARLSQRENHILSLVTDRMSNKQIARFLGLELSTIKNHVHNILVKLDVQNRTEAAALFRGAV
jgi:DNA-binding NarL/FixJ family response regulator